MIKYSIHARDKLKLLSEFSIDESIVEKSLIEPNEVYYDSLLSSAIAVKKLNEDAGVIIAFVKEDKDIKVLTIYYTTKLNKVVNAKIRGGRWIKVG
ncbi:hypothetical protein KEJ50_06960 [Candidatus Bathyarchaeota archaeon]|nr:hypothetical protein [Candidatus Bathyarchaeota archaeon]